ncbi:MAG TPA: response regulator [Chloroflexia bacterium]|nr:response regulator [Chloroflexia bacterium]
MSPDPSTLRETILLVEDESQIRTLLTLALRRVGYDVTAAATGREALARLAEVTPDLVISDVNMPDLDGFDLVRHMRAAPALRAVPLLLLSGRGTTEDMVAGLELGADDYLPKPFHMAELLARVRVRMDRPPVPRDLLPHNRQTLLLSERVFEEELYREKARIERGGAPGCLAFLYLEELVALRDHLSLREQILIARHIAERIEKNTRLLDSATHDAAGHFLILLPATNLRAARIPLRRLVRRIVGEPFIVDNVSIPLTPRVGIASFRGTSTVADLRTAARQALEMAIAQQADEPVLAAAPRIGSLDASPGAERAAPVVPAAAHIVGQVVVAVGEDRLREQIRMALVGAGYQVVVASTGRMALEYVATTPPDLLIATTDLPEFSGLDLLQQVRADPTLRAIAVMLLTHPWPAKETLAGLTLGADDCLPTPFAMPELLARVRARVERPPMPCDLLPRDHQTALFSEQAFIYELVREVARAGRHGPPGVLAYLELDELPRVAERLGRRAAAEIAKQVGALLRAADWPLAIQARERSGRFMILLPETAAAPAAAHLEGIGRRIMGHTFTAAGERLNLTPTLGFAPFTTALPLDALRDHARVAQNYAATLLDLRPQEYTPALDTALAQQRAAQVGHHVPWWDRLYTQFIIPIQIGITLILGLVIPFCLYAILDTLHYDITPVMYLVVAAALLLTSYFIWMEGLLALDPDQPPAAPGAPYPPASAIIAAYLPNEAATVVDTIEAFLAIDYPAPLQIILAYNTPRDMPIETVLRDLAARAPRFLPLRVPGSTSKAQNVNAALAVVSGEFVGVFDADHHPMPGSYKRAWRWLSHGYDVVQGHCLVRNGAASWMARLVAVEFEAIYAVSHPGRARLHTFAIFGGSNGYWQTALLRQIRMRGSMLTEDIDSSMRALEAGHRIASDPYLVSRELATTTIKATWHQRMRWAQGWFQVSLKHCRQGLASPHLSPRQKFGIFHLLIWREIYPWLSIQMFPILGYWMLRAGGPQHLNWLVPAWVMMSLFTFSVGPGQFLFAYLLAAPEIRRRPRWFLFYLVLASLFYTEFKNTIARVAQIKELMYERSWKVTPRPAPPPPAQGQP